MKQKDNRAAAAAYVKWPVIRLPSSSRGSGRNAPAAMVDVAGTVSVAVGPPTYRSLGTPTDRGKSYIRVSEKYLRDLPIGGAHACSK